MDEYQEAPKRSRLTPSDARSSYTLAMPKRREGRFSLALLGYLIVLLSFGVGIITMSVLKPAQEATTVVVQAATSSLPRALAYGSEPLLSQPNFFAETLATFKENQQSFVEADLSAMKIRYYEKGTVKFEADILSKGKEGSWWETPAGLYAIQSKTPNHLSSFGGVYQPWSLVFQGNFFIHGWPYYPDGTAVSSQYSGGCIRLADVNAKKLYEYVKVGTPVLVYEEDYQPDTFQYFVEEPDISAENYLVADVQNGTILTSENVDEKAAIASITKLMTALVAAEYINLDKTVTVTEDLLASTSIQTRLEKGDSMSAYSLLLPLLLESDNTAAKVLAAQRGQSQFVSYMNKKAAALGMTNTTFVDPSGAYAGNVSTAEDLLHLATYIFNNRSFVLSISSGAKVNTAYTVYNFGTLANFNLTPNLTDFVGGKVGQSTAAGETALVLYKMKLRGEERVIAFVVLGSKDRYSDVQKLHQYVSSQFGS